jgi:thioredoxin:protein disulfide reductase
VEDSDAWRELLPQFTIAGQEAGYLESQDFLAWVDRVESGEVLEAPAGFLAAVRRLFSGGLDFAGMGMPLVIALTLIGGLALNLTPCVLPVIPINLAIIGAGAQAGSRGRGFMLGSVYGLGIALVYGVLGLVVVLGLGSFGNINASPWFNFGIAALFVVLALAMFDLILIDFSKYQTKFGVKSEKGSFVFAFFMGSICALLAGACVAPVVIAVILYSQDVYAQGHQLTGLLLPFLLGLGMALPWPIAGAGLSFMPKPGMWMVRVKQAFGVFIFAFAAYYGYQGYTILSERFVDKEAVAASADESGWVTSLSDGLEQAKAENKPVLIDFWATWCKNCLVMNKTTFKDEAVLARLDEFVKIKYQAEDPGESPAKDVLAHFEYVGLPHYAILHPPEQ